MKKLDLEKVYKLFENFDTNTDCYPGSMFVRIYNECPICYTFTFDNKNKIQLTKFVDKPAFKNIKHNIDDRMLLNGFVGDNRFEIIQYSPHSHLILGKEFPFLTILELSDTSDKSVSMFQCVYINGDITDEELDNIHEIVAPYFVPVNREQEIDFGIAAVDASGSLYTNYYEFKSIKVDVKKNYNDDLPYKRMVEILNTEDSAELMLFYGEPGTGKSTLIKKFITEIPEKDFVFMDGTLLANVQQDRLMSYFLENQDTVFIFEDCEKILLDRENNYNPTMSILLNLTDGIISDILNIKIICTFNTKLSKIDTALLRKGRLTLKYEFKKLCKEKAQKLLKGETITKDMSLADIYNFKEENDYSKKIQSTIGFK